MSILAELTGYLYGGVTCSRVHFTFSEAMESSVVDQFGVLQRPQLPCMGSLFQVRLFTVAVGLTPTLYFVLCSHAGLSSAVWALYC
jgi:hypothetical protein